MRYVKSFLGNSLLRYIKSFLGGSFLGDSSLGGRGGQLTAIRKELPGNSFLGNSLLRYIKSSLGDSSL